jgi:hypothetical protein
LGAHAADMQPPARKGGELQGGGDAEHLGGGAEGEQQAQQLSNEASSFLGASLDVARSWLSGELPSDVTKAVRQATSEASQSLGLGTGSAARNLTIRDLGRTSLDLQAKGMEAGVQVSQLVQSYEIERQRLLQSAKELDLKEYDVRNQLALSAERLANDRLQLQVQDYNNWLDSYTDAMLSDRAADNPDFTNPWLQREPDYPRY